MFEKIKKREINITQSTNTESTVDPSNKYLKIVIVAICIFMSLFHIYHIGIKPILPSLSYRACHVGFALTIIFLVYPRTKKAKNINFIDGILACLSVLMAVYIIFNYSALINTRAGLPNLWDLVVGGIATVLCLEACRRTMGWPLVITALCFFAYVLLGNSLPGFLGHRGYDIPRVLEQMLGETGIFGTPIYVTSTFVFMFMVLGAILRESGGAKAFIDLALAFTGRSRGGPAKAAVLASSFFGAISGSSFANVAGTGTFTIPLMKSKHYEPEFAGAVEAASSAGGQITPPIMGAAAFIMAEMTGIAYGKIILYAALPAFLYYLSIFITVDIHSKKIGLVGLPKEELPSIRKTMGKNFILLLAPLSIVVFLIMGQSAMKAAFSAVVLAYVCGFINKENRLNFKKTIDILVDAAKSSLSLIVACAVAGMIVGCVSLSGLGLRFADIVLIISNGQVIIALMLCMVACIILSMGMGTASLYIIMASMVAPGLVKLGVPIVAAHLFIFYFGCFSAVTPPVALSSYLAAGIAGANPTKTALLGWRLCLVAFILPYMFVYSPILVLQGQFSMGILIRAVITCIIGIMALSSSLEGFMFMKINFVERIILFVSSLFLIQPALTTDLLGVAVLLVISLKNYGHHKKLMTEQLS